MGKKKSKRTQRNNFTNRIFATHTYVTSNQRTDNASITASVVEHKLLLRLFRSDCSKTRADWGPRGSCHLRN